MSEAKTKSCNLTEVEIKTLIAATMQQTSNSLDTNSLNLDNRLDRINYLNKRLKAFNEPEFAKLQATTEGWPTNV